MPITQTEDWDVLVPANTDNPQDGDDDIRQLKRAEDERMRNMGAHWPGTTDANAGRLQTSRQGVTGELNLVQDQATSAELIIVRGTDHASDTNVVRAPSLDAYFNTITTDDAAATSVIAGQLDVQGALNPTGGINFGQQPVFVASGTIGNDAILVIGQPSVSGGSITLTLPACSTGRRAIWLKNIDDPTVTGLTTMTIQRAGSDTISSNTLGPLQTSIALTSGISGASGPRATLLVSNGTSIWQQLF
jgi:hypothetical protein